MPSQILIGVMGPGENANEEDISLAKKIGVCIARLGYTLLTGGRNCGVMHAALQGAKSEGGTTIGVLPGDTAKNISEFVDIPIITGLGNARNTINVLSSKIIIAVGKGPGTLSEIALAIKTGTPVICYNISTRLIDELKTLDNKNIFAPKQFDNSQLEEMITEILRKDG